MAFPTVASGMGPVSPRRWEGRKCAEGGMVREPRTLQDLGQAWKAVPLSAASRVGVRGMCFQTHRLDLTGVYLKQLRLGRG